MYCCYFYLFVVIYFYKLSKIYIELEMKNLKDKFYVTTPIYYPSGKFHIGTAYTTVLADSMKKYHQLKGEDAYMLTRYR